MRTKETLLSRSLLLGAATGISKVAVFLLMPLYTAYLTPAAFGAADIIAGTAVLLLPFVSFNAPEAVFRFRAGGDRGADRGLHGAEGPHRRGGEGGDQARELGIVGEGLEGTGGHGSED